MTTFDDLPRDVVLLLLEHFVLSRTICDAAQLRLVCKRFSAAVLEVMFRCIPTADFLNLVNASRYKSIPHSNHMRYSWAARYLSFLTRAQRAVGRQAAWYVTALSAVIEKLTTSGNNETGVMQDLQHEVALDSRRIWDLLCHLTCNRANINLIVAIISGMKRPSTPYRKPKDDGFAPTNTLEGNILVAAAFLGYEQIIRELVNIGVDVNQRTLYFGSPLMAASAGGHTSIVNFLVEHGAYAHSRYSVPQVFCHQIWLGQKTRVTDDMRADLETALEAASKSGKVSTVAVLLAASQHGFAFEQANVREAIRRAAEGDHIQIIVMLLKLPMWDNINRQAILQDMLVPAAQFGRYNLVRKLIAIGVEVNWRDEVRGGTAICRAARYGFHETVACLLEANAYPWCFESISFNEDAVLLAAQSGYIKVLECLLERGAQVDGYQYLPTLNPLYLAVKANHQEVVRYLLSQGADPGLSAPQIYLHLGREMGRQCSELSVVMLEHARRQGYRTTFRLLWTHRIAYDVKLRLDKPAWVLSKLDQAWLDSSKDLDSFSDGPYFDFIRPSYRKFHHQSYKLRLCNRMPILSQQERDFMDRSETLKKMPESSMDNIYRILESRPTVDK